MMRRLIVCADGTWNSDDEGKGHPTNVVKMARAIRPVAPDGTSQVVFYHKGVGTGKLLDRWFGGAFGKGLSENVTACYRFLVDNYNDPNSDGDGDQIFLFGFSRGAFTVRSLAGFIRNVGILKPEHADKIDEAYARYRNPGDDWHPSGPRATEFRARYSRDVPNIRCVGVWDTVGSLGVPTRGAIGSYTRKKYGFHNVALSGRVENAFHALAIDERRKPFAPSLWEVPESDRLKSPQQRVEQVWFAGVHSNVGGGYPDSGLSDVAFLWMMERAGECGLVFDDAFVRQAVRAAIDGKLENSFSTMYRAFGPYVREICVPRTSESGEPIHTFERVHESALERREKCPSPPKGPYSPTNLLAYLERAERRATPRDGTPGVQIPPGAGPSVMRDVGAASPPPPPPA
jgi:uncharacterized protein (DUF2235 family)